ncbi:MAG: HAD family hydrolase [Chloroflexi bacterium]|nr:HAD family hydrolase [Chloroflexota bacterium]
MLKGILFDLDDTLIDWSDFSDNWEVRELQHLRGVYDYVHREVHPLSVDLETYAQEYYKRVRDAWMGARESLLAPHLGRILLETAQHMGAPADKLDMQRCLDEYRWAAPQSTSAFPDAREGLQILRAHGIRVGIVTNAFQPMSLRDIEMRAHGLLEFFPDCRISAADVGYLKPHPTIFKTALECLGTKPEETLFVGDNPVADIAGAQGAGLKGVLRVKHPTQPLISGVIVPDGAINTLHDLLLLLDKWYPGWRSTSSSPHKIAISS